MDGTVPSRRFPIGLTIAAAIVFVVLIGLGVWQLQRLKWKEHLLAQIAAVQHAPAKPLVDALADARAGHDVSFVRVTATCPGIADAPFVELYGVVDGRAGVRLVSACTTPGAGWSGVLVDRGFIDTDDKIRPPSDGKATTPVVVTGVLRKPDPPNAFTPQHGPGQPMFFWRDVAGISKALNAPNMAPLMLAAETPTAANVKPVALPPEIPNNHLQYALTWFGFAFVLLCFYAAMLRKRLSGGAT